MSREFPTFDELVEVALGWYQVAHTDPVTNECPPLGPRTFLGQEARALAGLVGEVLGLVKAVDDDQIPYVYTDAAGVLRTRNSSRSLEDWAETLGLPSGVPGKYGRKGPTAATGGGATVSGPPGTPFATGAQLVDQSGKVYFKVRGGFTIPIGGSQGFTVDAVTLGEGGRLPTGAVLRWSSPPPGVPATVTLTTGLSGGTMQESDIELALRIVGRLRDRYKAGSPADYREWAETAVDDYDVPLGVSRAYVYPVRDGAGSVTVVITTSGSGQGRDPGAAVQAKVQAYMDRQKIATDTCYVLRPRFEAGEELTVQALIVPTEGNEFAYDDTVPMLAIAGTGTTLVANASPPPVTMTDAIDNGDRPLLAIAFPGNPVPFVARALAYQLDTPVVGQTTFTLDSGMPSSPGGYRIWPGSLATVPVAVAVAALVDALGPSRSSGYANPRDAWQDDVQIAALAAAVLGAVNASGEKVVFKDPNVGLGVGLQIAVGPAIGTAADFTVWDNQPGQAPQLAELAAVVVRKA